MYVSKNITFIFFPLFQTGIRRNEEGVPEDEENFDEAIRNVNTSLVPTRVCEYLDIFMVFFFTLLNPATDSYYMYMYIYSTHPTFMHA